MEWLPDHWLVPVSVLSAVSASFATSVVWNWKRYRKPPRAVNETEAMAQVELMMHVTRKALALSSMEGPLGKVTYDSRRMVNTPADKYLDRFVVPEPDRQTAEEYLRTNDIPFPVSRAGIPEGVAVWQGELDRCEVCKHTIGSANTTNGVPYIMCETRPDGAPCGKYRTVIYLDDAQLSEAAREAREASMRLRLDMPTTLPEDPEIRGWYGERKRLAHDRQQRIARHTEAAARGEWAHCHGCPCPDHCQTTQRCWTAGEQERKG